MRAGNGAGAGEGEAGPGTGGSMLKGCLGFGVAVVLVSAAVVYAFGLGIPENHSVARSAIVEAPMDSVWRAITSPSDFPTWRPGVSEVTVLSDRDLPAWRETASGETLTFEVVRMQPPRELVTRIADEGLPFGGTWIHRLEPRGNRTRVTITENGQIHSPVYRFVSQFILGYEGSLTAYLEGLTRRFGGTLEPSEGPVVPVPDDSVSLPGRP